MLREAAAKTWNVPVDEVATEAGTLYHKSSGKTAGYGEMASAASRIPVPEEVQLKDVKDFKIIGTSRKNVDGLKIVTGQPLFGTDYHREGMLIAMIAHPPAFGLKLKSVDDSAARAMPGIRDIFTIKALEEDYEKQYFDTCTFPELVAVVGNSTWEVMNAKKALKIEWAPISNFIAGAEQSFLDEVAEAAGKDPIEFRLELLERAQNNPVGENNDYDPARYAGVLGLVREKSGWGREQSNVHRGVSAYFCHDSYVAQVLDLVVENGKPVVQKVCCAIDCGIVVNPDAAINLAEGAIVDGIGCAMYGAMAFKEGVPEQSNFDKYRMIRMSEAPKEIEVHFVQNQIAPTGMGEPPFPPVFGALANALYRATGKRVYHQPFLGDKQVLG